MMIKEIYKSIKQNFSFLFLAFCLISSSLAVVPYGLLFYSIGIVIIFRHIAISRSYFKSQNSSFVFFLFICYISSICAGLFDYRIFLFTVMLLAVTPILTSKKAFIFRKKYIEYSLYVFPILAIVSLYCYYAGINMMSSDDGSVSWDFSALFWHSMWLGAANGISNIVLLWMLRQYKSNIVKIMIVVCLMGSLLLSVVSGSRSALFASLIAMLYYIYISSRDVKRFSTSIIIIAILGLLSFPFYYESADRMINKFEYQENSGVTSRDEIFEMRRLDIEESPIIGVGFAVGHSIKTHKKELGRIESGSGWLSIISQLGFIGFMIITYIIIKAYKRIKPVIKHDNFLQLIVPVFLYLCAHSLFEGYILTAGYYLCILFWGILGLMYVYPIENKALSSYRIKK